jgi:hypothetical protein
MCRYSTVLFWVCTILVNLAIPPCIQRLLALACENLRGLLVLFLELFSASRQSLSEKTDRLQQLADVNLMLVNFTGTWTMDEIEFVYSPRIAIRYGGSNLWFLSTH